MNQLLFANNAHEYTQLSRASQRHSISALFILLLFSGFSNVIQGQAVSAGLAPVTPPAGQFRIEGDLKANTPANTGDWLPGAGGTGGAVLDAFGVVLNSATTYHRTDLFTAGDNIFAGGLKKDGDLTKYTWKNGNPSPGKCDINHLLVHIADAANGDTWITLAGDREEINGNSFISIALLQKTLTANANFTFTSGAPSSTGGRTLGDVQISAEFTGGGDDPNLYLEEWRKVGTAYKWVAFSIDPIPAFGSTNGASIPGMPYTVFTNNTYQTNAFIEVSFNISEIYRNTAAACVGSIASMLVMTKSSQAVNADLADFVDPLQINLDINVGKPAAQGATYCVGQTIANLSATGETGATFKWYTGVDANGKPTGTPVEGSSYTPAINNQISGTYHFYVTQTLKGCESEPTKVTVVVSPLPTANAGADPANQCFAAAGNVFNLTGTGTNGAPTWTIAPGGNPSNLTVDISGANTLQPTVTITGNSAGGNVTLLLTVSSDQTPSCGDATDDVKLTIAAQVGGPDAVMLVPVCTDPTFKVQVNSPVQGTKYTITQPLNNNPLSAEFTYNGSNGPVIFSGLKFGDGFNVVASKDGCTSAPTKCPEDQLVQRSETGVRSVEARLSSATPTKVLAFPNPYRDHIKFNLQSEISGQGSLELYNMIGQKVKNVFQGYIQKGQTRTVEFSVPYNLRNNLVYVFRIGDQRTSGKLINFSK